MNYHVLWTAQAEEVLVNLWTTAADSAAIASAANQMNDLLARNPDGVGESRDQDRRILFVLPLAAEFIVDSANMIVTVTRLWRMSRKDK